MKKFQHFFFSDKEFVVGQVLLHLFALSILEFNPLKQYSSRNSTKYKKFQAKFTFEKNCQQKGPNLAIFHPFFDIANEIGL